MELAAAERAGHRGAGVELDASLAGLVSAIRTHACWLTPFLPDTAASLTAQLTADPQGRLPASRPLLARLVA